LILLDKFGIIDLNLKQKETIMRIGIKIKIDVTKIDKNRIFNGAKGKYIDLISFIDTDKVGTFGDHGFVSQEVSKEEKDNGIKTPILGNVTVFYGLEKKGSQPQSQGYQPNQQAGYVPPQDNCPF